MNQEEYYLNQDMTTECIQLPNQFQQGDCLIKQNYLSELSQNPGRALQNLGLDPDINNKVISLLECCDTVRQNITNITNNVTANYNDIQELTSRIDELPIDTNKLRLRYLIELGESNVQFITPDNVVSQDENWKNTIYLELWNYGDSLQKYYESYNGYIIKQIDHGGGAPEYKWVQISQSLFPDNDIDTLIAQLVNDNLSSNLENYLIKNTSVNQGNVDITIGKFRLKSDEFIINDYNVIFYKPIGINGNPFISNPSNYNYILGNDNNLCKIQFKSNQSLSRIDTTGNTHKLLESSDLKLSTNYSALSDNQTIAPNDSFETAFAKLEGRLNNLPSGEGSGECDCPELPDWVTPTKPDFGEKNIIETINLNETSLSVTNKTVNIQETITSASDGLKIENYVVKHINSLNNIPNSEILCKIKFDGQGHITSYQKIDINDLAAQLLGTGLFEPSSDYVEVESVQITPASATLTDDNNHTQQLSATTYGANNQEATNQNIIWNSSDPSIVRVNDDGLITGQKTGTATITATSHNGKTTSIEVNVQFSTTYYFSVGTIPVTEDNYTRVNNPTTDIPTTKEYINSGARAFVYILVPSDKTVSVREKVLGGVVTVSEIVSISRHKVYKTGSAVAQDGTIIITLN